MKKILLTSIAVAGFTSYCASAFGQGTILFENSDGSSFVTTGPGGPATSGAKTTSGLIVELYWENPANSSFVLEDTFTSTYTGVLGQNGQGPGFFSAGELTIPSAGTETFYVEGFYTSGTTPYSGKTANITATVESGSTPPVSTDSGSWAGNLTLLPIVPEPTTIVLGGLGAAALLLFRRKK